MVWGEEGGGGHVWGGGEGGGRDAWTLWEQRSLRRGQALRTFSRVFCCWWWFFFFVLFFVFVVVVVF